MLRAFLTLFLVFSPALAWAQQQTPPPPDTSGARERHRQRELQPPPPEGPWGPDQFDFTWNKFIWRGLFFSVGSYAGASIDLNVPHGLAATSDGINPPIFETLTWRSEKFSTIDAGVTADFDVLRFSATGFGGTFHARTTLTYDDGISPPTSTYHNLSGDVYGFRIGAYWPAFRYRDSSFEASIGPATTVGWMHEELRDIPGTLLHRDTVDILTGSLGPKISLRGMLGRFAVDVTGEYSFVTGASRGWTKELSVGIGYSF